MAHITLTQHRQAERLAADTMGIARIRATDRGHRLGQAIRPPFVPIGPVDYRRRAFCSRCPADVTVDAVPAGAAITSGLAVDAWCTGVLRFVVDGTPVAFTGSRTDAYIRRTLGRLAREHTGHIVELLYPTTGPDADWHPARPGAAERRRIGGSRRVTSATVRS